MNKVRLPDGKEIELEAGATALDAALSIGPGLAKAARGAVVDGTPTDLFGELPDGAEIRILTERDPETIDLARHTLAHCMAQAVAEIFAAEGHERGEVRLGIGPVIEHGFYYDFDLPRPLKEEDLETIAKRMEEIVSADLPLRKYQLSREEALARFEGLGDPSRCSSSCAIPIGRN